MRSPWTPHKKVNTLILPAYSGICKTVPLCLVVPHTTEVAISVKNLCINKQTGNNQNNNSLFGDNSNSFSSSRRNSRLGQQQQQPTPDRVVGVLVPDDDPNNLFIQKPVGFTFSKSADPNSLIWRGDVIAGTYRLFCYSYTVPRPSPNNSQSVLNSLSSNGSYLSLQAKSSLSEIFNLFDLDGDKHLNREEYELFYKCTSDNQSLGDAGWREILQKLKTSAGRITKDAFMALHQGYLQDDRRNLLHNLVECGVCPVEDQNARNGISFNLRSIKTEVTVTALNYNVDLSLYNINYHTLTTRDLTSLFDNYDKKRPLANLPDNICHGSGLVRLYIIDGAHNEVYVVCTNLNDSAKAQLSVNLGGSKNVKWVDYNNDQIAVGPRSSKLLGVAGVIDESVNLDFIMSLVSLSVA